MNAEQWNALHPVGTLVFAYPGARPEDFPSARRLVTRTRTVAQTSASGHPVVWVEDEGSYICLTHVDPVSKDEWEKARAAEAVAELGAVPAPMGDEPQVPMSLKAARVRLAQYGERTSTWSTATYNDGTEKALHEIALTLLAEVNRLEAERHVTNEALSDAAEALRANRDRIAEQTRYAAHLEAEVCQCQPELDTGEYMHEASCPVADIQMRAIGCPGFEDNPVAPNLCAGCHEPRESHKAVAA